MVSPEDPKSEPGAVTKQQLLLHPYAISVSPEQYAWLFDDLKEFTAADALRHYEEFGKAEIRSMRRQIDPVRLLTLRAQLLSSFPRDVPGPYFALTIGPKSGLDIYFPTTGMPVGRFYFSHVAAQSPNICLFVNVSASDWYHSGIPGIATDVPSVADWLKRLIAELQPQHIRCFGGSMSAYAAILFGNAVEAHAVYSVDPEFQLGRRLSSSRRFELERGVKFDSRYLDIRSQVHALGPRLKLLLSGWDVKEARSVYKMCRAGVAFYLLRNFHGQIEGSVEWTALIADDQLVFPGSAQMPGDNARETSFWMNKAHVAASYRRYERCLAALNCAMQCGGNEGLLVYRAAINYLLGNLMAAKEDAENFSSQYRALGLKSMVPIEALARMHLFTDPEKGREIAEFWNKIGLKKLTRKLFFRNYVRVDEEP